MIKIYFFIANQPLNFINRSHLTLQDFGSVLIQVLNDRFDSTTFERIK